MPYIAYYVAQQHKGMKGFALTRKSALDSVTLIHQKIIDDFLGSIDESDGLKQSNTSKDFEENQGTQILETFYDTFDSRRTAKWPQLLKAIEACKQRGATLLITELGTLAKNESFAEPLIASGINFHCCDQPFVDRDILSALSKSAQVEKKLHGKLIREGLKMTSAKSGNPNAAKVIGEVNKPKIHTAIVFAFVLQLILNDYMANGYSQRDMVKNLNEEGFTAPEGGTWVLSQFQKVLERVRLNKVATTYQATLLELAEQGLSAQEIAADFNTKSIPPLKRTAWDEQQIKKLQERIQQIQDIVLLNRFVLSLLPLLHDYHKQEIALSTILSECEDAGIPIRALHNASIQHEERKSILIPPNRRVLLEQLKRDVVAFPEETAFLQTALESTMKHLPAYLTIVKSHIEQLAKVLELENHHHQELAKANLAEPVNQLIQLFKELRDQDFQTLENLFLATTTWQTDMPESVETQTEVVI